MTREQQRLQEAATGPIPQWQRWGPYVSERSWATVREDYSPDGCAWEYFPHDHARSRAYRWGEDGIAGWCDRYQVLVFSLALWNGRDPILKERLFGLTGNEGNHAEDVKEYYFYLDATPTHSYMKYLYKYPQAEFPYVRLVEENRRRGRHEGEFELLETGVFDENRYFDVVIEYARATPEDTCIRIEAFNRGPDEAPLHLLPHLWFRNTWAWGAEARTEPRITRARSIAGGVALLADDLNLEMVRRLPFAYRIGKRTLYGPPGGTPLFTNNETHAERVYGPWAHSRSPFVKDAFHRHVIHGDLCVNPERAGTKACLHYAGLPVPAGGSVVLRLRLADRPTREPLEDVDRIVAERRADADEFYDALHPRGASEEERRIQRQALAGMIWSKQIYLFNVHQWLEGDNPNWPPPASRHHGRNTQWRRLNSMRVMSMPDKWEYPWFAAWDLAFHCLSFALVDPAFAKEQLWLLLFEQFQHRNGQIPAYEWEFSDLNPPVHAWAVWRVYRMEQERFGRSDRVFLARCFQKLLINFAWWVNRVDSQGNDVFEGGFLGLDNITVLDRSHGLPGGAVLEQSDGTGWMGFFCLNMMRIALELAREDRAYEAPATKFFEHYVYIAAAMKHMGGRDYSLWDEEDGFFYDVLRYPDGAFHKFRVRSLVGIIPLYAVEVVEAAEIEALPEFRTNFHWFLQNRAEITRHCVTTVERDGKQVHVLAIMDPDQMRRLLARVWDPAEFRSDYGLRSLSKHHEAHPFVFGDDVVGYEPGESTEPLKGGNSNWRGPIWFPTSYLFIDTLRRLHAAHGDRFTVDPGDGTARVRLDEMAQTFVQGLLRLFTADASGRRASHGDAPPFQSDPHWRDLLLFYEHFHGDTGRGLGASHQTGWTGLIANLIDEWRRVPTAPRLAPKGRDRRQRGEH